MDFDYNTILICLEQKELFVKDILSITEHIEIEARKEEIHLDDLLAERQNRIERIKKCNEVIKNSLAELDDAERNRIKQLIDGESFSFVNHEEERIVELGTSTRNCLSKIRDVDKVAMELLAAQREEARKMLIEINHESQGGEANQVFQKENFIKEAKSLTLE